jgi:hypothetical protein
MRQSASRERSTRARRSWVISVKPACACRGLGRGDAHEVYSLRLSTPDTHELVLRVRLGTVVVRTAIILAMLAGCSLSARIFGRDLTWWCAGAAVLILVWAVVDLLAPKRFRVVHGTGQLERPHGPPIALDSIVSVRVSALQPEVPGLKEVMVHQRDQQGVLVYVGPEAWAHEVAQFIEGEKQIHAQRTSV